MDSPLVIGIFSSLIAAIILAVWAKSRGTISRAWRALRGQPYSELRFVPGARELQWHWAEQESGKFRIQWMGQVHVTNDGNRPNAPLHGSVSYKKHHSEFHPNMTNLVRGFHPSPYQVEEMPVDELDAGATARMDILAFSAEMDAEGRPSEESLKCRLEIRDKYGERYRLKLNFREVA